MAMMGDRSRPTPLKGKNLLIRVSTGSVALIKKVIPGLLGLGLNHDKTVLTMIMIIYKLIPKSSIFAMAKTIFPSKASVSQLKRLAPGAKDSGPDPDHVGSLLDGDLKITGHPHGKISHFDIRNAFLF